MADSADILNYNRNFDNAMYISLRLGITSLIVDTGASVSLCTQKVLPKTCIIEKVNSNVKLKGVTGTDVPVVDTSNLKIQIGNRIIIMKSMLYKN